MKGRTIKLRWIRRTVKWFFKNQSWPPVYLKLRDLLRLLKLYILKTKIKRCQQQKYINLNADTLTKTWCNKQHWRMKPSYMWNVEHNMWNTSINWITTWIKNERDSWRMIYVEPSSHRSRISLLSLF